MDRADDVLDPHQFGNRPEGGGVFDRCGVIGLHRHGRVAQINADGGAETGEIGNIHARAVQKADEIARIAGVQQIGVVPRFAQQFIQPGAAIQRIVIVAAMDRVIAGIAKDGIIARPGEIAVIARQQIDTVIAGCAAQGVIAGGRGRWQRRAEVKQFVAELDEFDPQQRIRAQRGRDLDPARDHRDHRVRAGDLVQHECVRATAAGDGIVRRIAGDRVIARAADSVFDHRANGDRDIGGKAADIGKLPVAQIDQLVLRKARHIQRVGAIAIPDRQERIGIGGEIIGPAHGGVEAIDRVPRVIAGIGAI